TPNSLFPTSLRLVVLVVALLIERHLPALVREMLPMRCRSPRRRVLLVLILVLGALNPQGTAADVPGKNVKAGANAVSNGDFDDGTSYNARGVTTTSRGTPPNSLPDGWYGGPGVGATATYGVVDFPPGQMDVPGQPKRYLRVAWKAPPSRDWKGETQHQPAFRFTFLEYFGLADVRRFAGQTVEFSYYAPAQEGPVELIPILWHSYDSQTPGIKGVKGRGYELFESSGKPGEVAVAQGPPTPSPSATSQPDGSAS